MDLLYRACRHGCMKQAWFSTLPPQVQRSPSASAHHCIPLVSCMLMNVKQACCPWTMVMCGRLQLRSGPHASACSRGMAPSVALQLAGSTSLSQDSLWCAAEACSGGLDRKVLQSKSHSWQHQTFTCGQASSPDCLTLLPPYPGGLLTALHCISATCPTVRHSSSDLSTCWQEFEMADELRQVVMAMNNSCAEHARYDVWHAEAAEAALCKPHSRPGMADIARVALPEAVLEAG